MHDIGQNSERCAASFGSFCQSRKSNLDHARNQKARQRGPETSGASAHRNRPDELDEPMTDYFLLGDTASLADLVDAAASDTHGRAIVIGGGFFGSEVDIFVWNVDFLNVFLVAFRGAMPCCVRTISAWNDMRYTSTFVQVKSREEYELTGDTLWLMRHGVGPPRVARLPLFSALPGFMPIEYRREHDGISISDHDALDTATQLLTTRVFHSALLKLIASKARYTRKPTFPDFDPVKLATVGSASTGDPSWRPFRDGHRSAPGRYLSPWAHLTLGGLEAEAHVFASFWEGAAAEAIVHMCRVQRQLDAIHTAVLGN
ncbi:hypothetical protein NM208_g15837 [Fusarium decemcellulare]|uniref:Uncharacterized protein n=1 Tax=Fusarium decemcellulare TaxID=57161 RepID=A0ACC1RC09_9HYPO|nr:hypothetical protein NM208_g15837 [Fusarium decemcellulare]